jgi:PAS domain S-box-containing protein
MNHNQTYRFWRSAALCLLGGIAVALVTFVCFRLDVSITTAALLYLIVVVLASLTGSFVLSAVVSIIAIVCLDYFFTEPLFNIDTTLRNPLNLVVLITFLGTALVITSLMAKMRKSLDVLREQAGLLDLTHDTVFVRDMNDVITYWNRGAAELYGWTREQAVGKVTHQLLQTIFPASLETINAELLRTGRWEGELVHTKRDGTQVIVASRWSMQQDEQGRPRATLETNNDISERRRAEEERRYHTQLLKTVTDSASSMLYIVDAAGLGTFVNPSLERITGYRAEELIGQVVHDKIHHTYPDGRRYPVSECPLTGAVRMRKPVRGEDLYVRKDGTFFPVRYTANPIFRDGEAVGTVIEVQDLTEPKAAEQELRKQAELLSLAHDAILVRDLESRITFWNPGAEKTYGWTAAEAIGTITHELLQTRFPVSLEALNVALQEQGEWEGELTHMTRHGAAIVVTSRQSLRRDEHGAPAAILEINRDVTERKRAEEEVRKLNEELEQRVIERTRDLEAVNKELEAFAYSVSHDLRAPLRHMAGYTELLQKNASSILDEKSRRYTMMILESAKRMGTLIDDLLAFSRVGRADIQKTTVSLDQILREALSEVRQETDGRNIVWRISALPNVRGDRSLLRLALVNLIANAIKFTGTRPQAEIEIGADAKEDEIVVFIRDNGVGFDMKYVNKLFGVFQRLHRTEEFEGTGIGLATVQRVIYRHGGRVWAEGVLDRGAIFYFTVPKS